MTRSTFTVRSRDTVLARIPLVLVSWSQVGFAVPDGLLREGIFLASRQAGATTESTSHLRDQDRLAATRRGYEIRGCWRPTPHGVFAGVALA